MRLPRRAARVGRMDDGEPLGAGGVGPEDPVQSIKS
jgi:hypothetical protein